VFSQTLTAWRLLIVDDGSTDDSVDIARAVRDPRVLVCADGRHEGLSRRLNEIAATCDTPLLARMDADDAMHPDRLAHQIQVLAQSQADVVGCGAFVMDEADRPYGERRVANGRVSLTSVLGRGGLIHPSVTGKTEWFRRNQYRCDFDRAEDVELWSRTCETSKLYATADRLMFYREPKKLNTRKSQKSALAKRNLILQRWRDLGVARTAGLLAGYTAVTLVYRGGSVFESAIRRRRSKDLADTDYRTAASTLAAIKATTVPGLRGR
jgi:glycosyltransferase involved in cell wall biosynthesis